MSPVTPAGITIEQFERGDIDAASFDHRAHVQVAWEYINAYSVAEALHRFDAALQRLVDELGESQKYHQTMTWFYVLLIGERSVGGESWSEFSSRNSDLFDSRRMLDKHYSSERLQSARARRQFLLPDKTAF